ncbi:MAG TPA: hypothetical protein EYP85_09105 [Armatimonadetes bacterium]|nr:hypothetical protein [Armatimonadota bacterium]
MGQFRAGAAEVVITPPVGGPMGGYLERWRESLGVQDDLYARALWVEDGETSIAFVTADVMGFDEGLVAYVRDLLRESLGLPAEQVLLNASHTHAGPAILPLRGEGERDESYLEVLARQLVSAVQLARQRATAARLGAGSASVQVGINRREKTADRGVILGRNPLGPAALYADVLKVETPERRPLAVLFSHPAHPIIWGPDNLNFSADFPGVAARVVQQVLGPETVAMFAQGCCGDVNPPVVQGTQADVERVGTLLGAAVLQAWPATPTEAEGTILAVRAEVPLFCEPPPPLEQAEQLVANAQERVTRYEIEHRLPGEQRAAQAEYEWARAVLAAARAVEDLPAPVCEVSAVAVNEIAIVGLAAEPFVQVALEIEERSPFMETMIWGCTNGLIGYIPTTEAYPEGGYEVEVAYKRYGTLPLRPESASRLADEAAELLRQLRQEQLIRSLAGGQFGGAIP